MLTEAVEAYEAGLTADVVLYLAERGIEPKARATARLGVVSDPHPGHGRFRDWLAIPYMRHDGEVRSLRFRCLASSDHNCRELGHGKYMSLPNEPVYIYNMPAIERAKAVIHLCEGELDAIVLGSLGYNAIAIPGAQAYKPRHGEILGGYARVNVWSDPDDAGADFLGKVAKSLPGIAQGVRLRLGDVTETFTQQGEDAIHSLVRGQAHDEDFQ